MPDIASEEALFAWLEDKPLAWARLIALRAALRSYPEAGDFPPERRVAFMAWAVLRLPDRDLRRQCQAAADQADTHVGVYVPTRTNARTQALHAAACAADPAGDLATACEAVAAAIRATEVQEYISSSGIFVPKDDWGQIGRDADWLAGTRDAGLGPMQLLGEPLWWGERSGADDQRASRLRRRMNEDGRADGAEVWADWYQRVLEGRGGFGLPPEADEAVIFRLAERENGFWLRDQEVVNAEILSWIDQAGRPDRGDETAEAPHADFAISCAQPDEAMAREVSRVLLAEGYTVGSEIFENTRFIALLSSGYEDSSLCQAEWAAAYARDPGGTRGSIIPLLLEPTELNPLARQVVYTSLIGLDEAARRRAIIEAVRYQAARREPREIRRIARETASPDVAVHGGKLHAIANQTFDRPARSGQLGELPANLRGLIDAIIPALPANTPPAVSSCLRQYATELAIRGVQPMIGLVKVLASAVEREFRSTEFELWGGGLSELFEGFFARHAQLIAHFPLSEARERFFSETPIDELRASGSTLSEPIRQASDALEQLAEAGLTTPDFDRVVADQRQQSKALAAMPPEGGETPSTSISPKRRFVLGSLGFYERGLVALSAIATLSVTPAIQVAASALAKAIERLLALIA